MENLKVDIRHVKWEFKNSKSTTDTTKKIVMFIAKVSLLTAESKTGF